MAVYKDKARGTWYFIKRVELPAGGMKQVKRRGFKTKKEALIAEESIEEELTAGEITTFKFVAEQYLEWYKKRRKNSSYMKIESIIRIHILPQFWMMAISDIRPRDITKYQDDLIGKYSVAHVKKIHTTISAIYTFAIKNEYAKENPASIAGNVELQPEKRVDFWTLDEFKAFISVVDEPLYRALFMTLYYSGMRKGELLALTWADLDFEYNIINVNKTDYYRKVTAPKTPASIRKIPMPKFVMRELSLLRSKSKFPIKMKYVVFGEFTTSLSTSTLDRKFSQYVHRSGVKKIRIHDFRHSHASYLINKGTIISVVAARLGHGEVSTTLNVYAHLFPSTQKEAVLAMEDDFKTAEIVEFKAK